MPASLHHLLTTQEQVKLSTLLPDGTLRYIAVFSLIIFATACGRNEFTDREKTILATLSLSKLTPAAAVSNKFAFDERAQQFGEELFHETKLSAGNEFSCGSCHLPEKFFTDGLPTGVAVETTTRNTPALHGAAWQSWFYWDGRRDSMWSQALTPIESPQEMAGDRVAVARFIAGDKNYRSQYETLFGSFPFTGQEEILSSSATPMGNQEQKENWAKLADHNQEKINTVFANIGKSMAAYQHTLAPIKTRFDLFIEEVVNGKKISSLNKHELAGARLFIDETKTQCLECHNGPLLSNGNFHNIATGNITGPVFDFGREFGLQAALLDEFNCQGKYSDAKPDECLHLVHIKRNAAHMRGAFKTPTLRNITNTGPYFHDGRFTTLEEVIRHYANPPALSGADEHELRPGFELTEQEITALTAFMQSFEPAQ